MLRKAHLSCQKIRVWHWWRAVFSRELGAFSIFLRIYRTKIPWCDMIPSQQSWVAEPYRILAKQHGNMASNNRFRRLFFPRIPGHSEIFGRFFSQIFLHTWSMVQIRNERHIQVSVCKFRSLETQTENTIQQSYSKTKTIQNSLKFEKQSCSSWHDQISMKNAHCICPSWSRLNSGCGLLFHFLWPSAFPKQTMRK